MSNNARGKKTQKTQDGTKKCIELKIENKNNKNNNLQRPPNLRIIQIWLEVKGASKRLEDSSYYLVNCWT
jgi:hypothetical protein